MMSISSQPAIPNASAWDPLWETHRDYLKRLLISQTRDLDLAAPLHRNRAKYARKMADWWKNYLSAIINGLWRQAPPCNR